MVTKEKYVVQSQIARLDLDTVNLLLPTILDAQGQGEYFGSGYVYVESGNFLTVLHTCMYYIQLEKLKWNYFSKIYPYIKKTSIFLVFQNSVPCNHIKYFRIVDGDGSKKQSKAVNK
jgi:hypothetical protein